MFNVDSFGSWMGFSELTVNGPAELEAYIKTFFEKYGFYVKIINDILPYADHFPFVAAGVPGITLIRLNCTAGRFFHHRFDDDMSRVSCDIMARALDSLALLMKDLSQRPVLPFTRTIPEEQAKKTERFWIDLFGGWEEQDAPGKRTEQ